MSGSPEVQRLARMWIEKAEEDLLVAQRLLDPPEVCPFSTVCFHAQQSVEKYIKAILVARSIPFPKAHDIGELLHLLPASVSVPLSVEEQELLTFYATTGRYPGEYEPVTRDDAERALAAARGVREAVRAKLPAETLG